jgi:hypothetical protein
VRLDDRVRELAIEIAAFAVVTGISFLLFFPHRSDYAGHYLAGLGATLMMLGGFLWLRGRSMSWFAVVLVVLAILFGVATEATVFRIAIFDPVDFSNQSLGAIAAGLLMYDVSRRRCGVAAAALGLFVLMAGFFFAFT